MRQPSDATCLRTIALQMVLQMVLSLEGVECRPK
jgi:hypothetical protein